MALARESQVPSKQGTEGESTLEQLKSINVDEDLERYRKIVQQNKSKSKVELNECLQVDSQKKASVEKQNEQI